MSVIAVGFGEKRAMPAIFSLNEGYVWVGVDLGARGRQNADEGIVRCIQNVRGHGNSLDNVCGRRASIVVGSAVEPAIERRHLVIEVTQAPDATHSTQVVFTGKTP